MSLLIPSRRRRLLCFLPFLSACILSAAAADAQVSFGTAIDLALRNSNAVAIAEADMAKSNAFRDETRDAYLPVVVLGSGLAYTNGFPIGDPSVAKVYSQGLLLNFSQRDLMRAAHAGFNSSRFSLQDARQQVILDTAFSYVQLDAVRQSLKALEEEQTNVEQLEKIVGNRLNAGYDTKVDVTRVKLAGAQVKLRKIDLEGQAQALLEHLSALTGIPASGFATDVATVPGFPEPATTADAHREATDSNAAIQAAYAQAKAKQYNAFAEHRVVLRPEVDSILQYGYFAGFNNYGQYYTHFTNSNVAAGVQIQFPIFNAAQRARAREADYDAIHAKREADSLRDQTAEQTTRLESAVRQTAAAEEVAFYSHELAQNKLDVILTEEQGSSTRNAAPSTPKDEQNARMEERQRYVDLLSARLEHVHNQLNLLKVTGTIEQWAKAALLTAPSHRP